MKWDENETLCWIMRWGWMTWKWSLAFNNDDGKTLQKNNKQIYLQKKNKKIKTSLLMMMISIPTPSVFIDLVHITFPEMEIKKLEHFFNY